MAIEKFIIDKSDLPALLKGEDIAIQPKRNIKGFCVEIAGNLTNGDVIKAMFPKLESREKAFEIELNVNKNKIGNISANWWNAPYEKGTEE